MSSALRRKRLAYAISMAQLAARAQVPYATLCRYERGYARPSRETAVRLAEALGTTVEEVFPGVPLPPRAGQNTID